MTETYDAIIIGSGQGGNPLAKELANQGKKTLLIEKNTVGGSCINYGCTPSKTLASSAKTAYTSKHSSLYGVKNKDTEVNMETVRERKQGKVELFRNSTLKSLQKTDEVDIIFGTASFVDAHHVEVTTEKDEKKQFQAELIFINTGSRPKVPDIKGIDTVSFLNSTTIMELNEVPEHLIILGGGYVGVEFSQMFLRFGSRVTLIEHHKHILSHEDEDVSKELQKILEEEGMNILCDSEAKHISSENGQILVEISNGKKIKGSHLLVATGKEYNTDELHLSKAGVEEEKNGSIKVNEKLQTSVSHIYAIGDVKGGPAFTHISYDDYRVIKDQLFGEKKRTIKDRLVPYTVFTDPQLGRVGMTEKEAKEKNIPYKVAKMPMSHAARAVETDEQKGFMKVLVHKEKGQILGCAILGAEGGEVMSMIEIAMMAELPYKRLENAIFAHPTLAESLNNVFKHFD